MGPIRKVFTKRQPAIDEFGLNAGKRYESIATADRFECTHRPPTSKIKHLKKVLWALRHTHTSRPYEASSRQNTALKHVGTSYFAVEYPTPKQIQKLFQEHRACFRRMQSPMTILLSNEILQDITPQAVQEKWYLVQLEGVSYVARSQSKDGQDLCWYYLWQQVKVPRLA